MKRKIQIAFGTIFYPLTMARYMLEALLRRKDVELWTYGPFTSTWIPWAGGMHIDSKYVYTPDFPMTYDPNAPTINYMLMEKSIPKQPDLWLEVNAGIHVHGRPNQSKYAVIGTDPHVLSGIYDLLRPRTDYFFGMQTPYLRQGDIFLPYGYDPIWHAASKIPMTERPYDAALLGLQYASRTQLMQHLQSMGLKVVYQLGLVYEQARDVYHKTKVGINWSSLQDTTARCYELMAMGCVPVLNRVPDLLQMFTDGEHFLGFDNMKEASDHVLRMVHDPQAAEEIARKAKSAVSGHTWDNRMEQVLFDTGLLK